MVMNPHLYAPQEDLVHLFQARALVSRDVDAVPPSKPLPFSPASLQCTRLAVLSSHACVYASGSSVFHTQVRRRRRVMFFGDWRP